MTKEKYAAERLDPRWQKKRLEIMERDGFKCRDCEDAKKTLSVHHAYYVTGRRCWEYPKFSLETLCKDCHSARHNREMDRVIGEEDEFSPLSEWENELDFVFGGNPSEGGRFWQAAAMIEMSVCDGADRGEVFRHIESALEHFQARK